MSDRPASWQPDPTGKHDHRYWDGTQWTDNVADAGVASTDPYEPIDEAVVSGDAPTAITRVPGDDTATYPTPVPPYPAPPPYVPPSPSAGGAASKGRGRRGLVVGGAILAAVLLAVIAFLALDDDDEPTGPLAGSSTQTTDVGDERTEGSTDGTDEESDEGSEGDERADGPSADDLDAFEDQFREGLGLSEAQAECLADRLGEAMEEGEIDESQAMADLFSFLADCDISLDDLTGGVDFDE